MPSNGLFEECFERYAKALVGYVRQLVGVGEAAEDIVHDTFVKLWERLDRLDPDTLGPWLFRVARNRALDLLSHRKVQLRYAASFERVDDFLPENVETFIESALAVLTPQQRAVFTMHCLDDLSLPEVAERLGISPRTAEKHLELARKKITTLQSR